MEEDPEKLKRSALNAWEVSDRVEAVKKIQDQEFLVNLVLHDLSGKVRQAALANLHDEDRLVLVAMRSKYEPLRAAAIEKLDSEDALLKIIDETEFPTSRKAAFDKLKDQQSLATVAIREGGLMAKNAIEKIDRLDLLLEIAWQSKEISTKWAAIEKIAMQDPSYNLQENYFQIAKSPIFSLNDRKKAVKHISNPDLLFKLISEVANEIEGDDSNLNSLSVDIDLSEFLSMIMKQIPSQFILQVVEDAELPLAIRKLAISHVESFEPLIGIIKSDSPLLIPAFVSLINEKGKHDLGVKLFKNLPLEKKIELLRTTVDHSFRETLFDSEESMQMKVVILESFQSPERIRKIIGETPPEVLSKLRAISKSMPWIDDLIDSQLKKTISLEFQTAEDAFYFLQNNPETSHFDEILNFLAGSPYLLKVLDLPVPLEVKKKVIEIVPDPVDLQILLLTLPDGEIKELIRNRLTD